MTTSDIGAQALEYIADIEIIRTKCGRMQGGLSGELRKRARGLSDLIRTLQQRAETRSDPESLKHKIEEIKQNKREEERKEREISELQDVIKELRKENKEIRDEMRREIKQIRKSIEKEKEKEYSPKIEPASHDVVATSCDDPVFRKDPSWTPDDDKSWPRLSPVAKKRKLKMETEWVMRSPLQGKSIPIPVREDLPTTSKSIPSMLFTSGNVSTKASNDKGIRLKSNIQVVPPRDGWTQRAASTLNKENMNPLQETHSQQSQLQSQTDWTLVGRNGKILKKEDPTKKKLKVKKEKSKIPKILKTAAISIKGNGKDFSYAEALQKVRLAVSLKDLEIQSPKIRKSMSGATIIEISGLNNVVKADKLAAEVQKVLQGEAHVVCPNIKSEMRLFGMDESISVDEIKDAIAVESKCKIEEVKVGRIGRTRSGTSVVWTQCPKEAAITIAERKRILIGWTSVRVEDS